MYGMIFEMITTTLTKYNKRHKTSKYALKLLFFFKTGLKTHSR